MKEYKGVKVPERNLEESIASLQRTLCSGGSCEGAVCSMCLYSGRNRELFYEVVGVSQSPVEWHSNREDT